MDIDSIFKEFWFVRDKNGDLKGWLASDKSWGETVRIAEELLQPHQTNFFV